MHVDARGFCGVGKQCNSDGTGVMICVDTELRKMDAGLKEEPRGGKSEEYSLSCQIGRNLPWPGCKPSRDARLV